MWLLYMTRLKIFAGQKYQVKPIIRKCQFAFQLCLFFFLHFNDCVMKRRKSERESLFNIGRDIFTRLWSLHDNVTSGLLESYVNKVRALTYLKKKVKYWAIVYTITSAPSTTDSAKPAAMVRSTGLEEVYSNCSPSTLQPVNDCPKSVQSESSSHWLFHRGVINHITEHDDIRAKAKETVFTTVCYHRTASYIGTLHATVCLFQMSIWCKVSNLSYGQ